jgi:SAM-dependent methyltransferase
VNSWESVNEADHREDVPHPILLSDGSLLNAAELESSELLALWFREEHQYAARLLSVPWDSQARRTLQRQAYSCIHELSSTYDRRLHRPISFGFRQSHGRLLSDRCVGALREKGQHGEAGRTPVLRLLEIGVGRGELYPYLCGSFMKHQKLFSGSRKASPGRVECWGCDLVIDSASLVPRHAASCQGNGQCGVDLVELREGELLDLAGHYEQIDAFDIVFWNDVIEHLPRSVADQYLVAIRRILRPGGCLITCTPNRLTGPHDVSRFVIPAGKQAMGLHLHEYSHRELRALLKRAGFRQFRSPMRAFPKKRPHGGLVAESIKWIVEPLLGRVPMTIRRRIIDHYSFDAIVCHTPTQ